MTAVDVVADDEQMGHPRGQSGAALLLVLAAIGLTSILVLSVLGLSVASLKLTRVRAEVAAEQRAADGALEAGVGRVALSTTSNPCTAVPPGSSLEFADESFASGDPLEVEVRCDPLPLPAVVPDDDSDEVLGGPAVEIVGARYGGALDVPTGIVEYPTLTHSGSAPLRFESDVTVARGAAARSSDVNGPAVSATGQYVQGLPGPSSTPSAACGDLDPGGSTPAISIGDRDSAPACDDGGARALAPRSGTIFSSVDVVSDRDVPGSCPGGATVEFQEGRYDAVDTARLNRLLDGSCPNKTFWFRPGKYSFDVNDAGISPVTDRHALVIDDATAKIVFGAPNGWTAASGASAAAFPRACNAGRSGASIQLSGRSTIRHRAGRVVICPAFNPLTDTPLPAIVQSETAPTQPILTSRTTTPAVTSNGWFPTAYTRCFDRFPFLVFFWIESWVHCADFPETRMHAIRSVDTRWASAGSDPLTSARVRFQTKETPPVHNARRLINIVVAPAVGSGCQTGFMEGGRTNGQFTEIDLLADSAGGNCVSMLSGTGITESIFEGARITIEHLYVDAGGVVDLACPAVVGPRSGCAVELWVGDIELATNSTQVAATSASSAAWASAQNAVVRDQAAAVVPQGVLCLFGVVGDPRCRNEAPGPRRISLGGFDPTAGGQFDVADGVESLGVVIDSRSASVQNWASLPIDVTSVRLDLTLASGTTPACSVDFEGFFRSVRTAYIDLFEEGGTCRAAVETMGQLVGASLTVSVVSNCMWYGSTPAPVINGRCDSVTLPDLDRVALELTSDRSDPPPTAEVAVAASTAATGTSFTVFGDTLLPSLDLDIRWKGEVTDLPIFGGFLSLDALGSRQEAGGTVGVVCCTPPPVTTLRLQASIDADVVGEAFLHVGPSGSGGVPPEVPSARRTIQVLDWRFCITTACPPPDVSPAVLGTVQGPTSPGDPPDPGD